MSDAGGYEVSHGKVRITPRRVSDHADHADGANAPDRAANHASDGRFKPGNRAATGTGGKRLVQRHVPARGKRLFESVCRQIGADAGTLGFMHAALCVSLYLDSLELAELARKAGLTTPEGKDADERATRKAEAAQREATAALATARLFKGAAKRGSKTAITALRKRVDAEEIDDEDET